MQDHRAQTMVYPKVRCAEGDTHIDFRMNGSVAREDG